MTAAAAATLLQLIEGAATFVIIMAVAGQRNLFFTVGITTGDDDFSVEQLARGCWWCCWTIIFGLLHFETAGHITREMGCSCCYCKRGGRRSSVDRRSLWMPVHLLVKVAFVPFVEHEKLKMDITQYLLSRSDDWDSL